MKAARVYKPGEIVIEDVPVPEISEKDVLIKVHRAGICGTDVSVVQGKVSAQLPVTLGHEFCGTVVSVGEDITEWKVGDRLVNWGVPNGAYAEYCLVIPEDVATIRVPDALSSEEAALLEVAMGAIRYLISPEDAMLIEEGHHAMVTGLGPSGLFFVQYAALCGATRVWAADHNEPRRELATALGAHRVFPTAEELASLITPEIEGDYFIDPVFQKELLHTWTLDEVEGQIMGAWFINFNNGKPGDGNRAAGVGDVRLVRNM